MENFSLVLWVLMILMVDINCHVVDQKEAQNDEDGESNSKLLSLWFRGRGLKGIPRWFPTPWPRPAFPLRYMSGIPWKFIGEGGGRSSYVKEGGAVGYSNGGDGSTSDATHNGGNGYGGDVGGGGKVGYFSSSGERGYVGEGSGVGMGYPVGGAGAQYEGGGIGYVGGGIGMGGGGGYVGGYDKGNNKDENGKCGGSPGSGGIDQPLADKNYTTSKISDCDKGFGSGGGIGGNDACGGGGGGGGGGGCGSGYGGGGGGGGGGGYGYGGGGGGGGGGGCGCGGGGGYGGGGGGGGGFGCEGGGEGGGSGCRCNFFGQPMICLPLVCGKNGCALPTKMPIDIEVDMEALLSKKQHNNPTDVQPNKVVNDVDIGVQRHPKKKN